MSDVQSSAGEARAAALRSGPSAVEISAWITSYIARLLGRTEAAFANSDAFDKIGLDSMMVIVMTEELGSWLRRDIEPTWAYDHPTIEKFATYVSVAA